VYPENWSDPSKRGFLIGDIGVSLKDKIDPAVDFLDEKIQTWNNTHGENAFVENYCGGIGNTVDLLNCGSMAAQDIATLHDLVGTGILFSTTVAGCFMGGVVGCKADLAEGILLWNSGLNVAETGASNISAILSVSADYIDDGKLGDTTATTVVAASAGMKAVDPFSDLLIDGYGSGYNHGLFPGVIQITNNVRAFFQNIFRK
jgi:hypothetical protein